MRGINKHYNISIAENEFSSSDTENYKLFIEKAAELIVKRYVDQDMKRKKKEENK